MRRGDIIEVARVFVRGRQLEHQWVPATIEKADRLSIVAVFADFSRREYQRDSYVIRPLQRSAS